MTPCGRFQAWMRPSTASFCSLGTRPQCPPITPGHQALVAEVVEAALGAVALTGGVDQAQVARMAGGEEAALQRQRQALGKADADETAGGHRVAVLHQGQRLVGP
jgi:hypothetical protein